MALADSSRAIGAVTKLLRDHLIRRGFTIVDVGRPEQAASANTGPKINLFLYEVSFDSHLKNISLSDDQPAPLWLSLKFLITAFDNNESSDSPAAQELLGGALSALHQLNFLRLDNSADADVRLALENNPEPLKITFDDTNVELLSKLMQGSDEKYRLSVAFQVRPIMIVPDVPPALSLLVGVDYTQPTPAIIGYDQVGLAVLAGLGPKLTSRSPLKFETLTILGEDLNVSGLEALVGTAAFGLSEQRPDRIAFSIPAATAHTVVSAGELPISVRQETAPGRYRSSNLLLGKLIPTVTTATPLALVLGPSGISGQIRFDGRLLGRADTDDIRVALYQNGNVVRTVDAGFVNNADQTQLTLTIPALTPVPAGDYLAILLVNGQQARRAPGVHLAIP
jgi:hypothetical protein